MKMTKDNLLLSLNRDNLVIPLSWAVARPETPFANLGDALSPIIVSALTGITSVHRRLNSPSERLACVGTIGHAIKNGKVHFWGTGVSNTKNPIDKNLNYYTLPPNTEITVHALRGKFSANVLKNQGLSVPEIYGDPVWFLPSIFKPASVKQHELGVILHISELTDYTYNAQPLQKYVRYKVPDSLTSAIKVFNMRTTSTFESLEEKINEITSCKRIVSTSLHGLVIAEAYNIPCAYFRTTGSGMACPRLDDENESIDYRMRDFYSGVGNETIFLYGQIRDKETDWDKLIEDIDRVWEPINWSADSFLESFPLPIVFNPLESKCFTNQELLKKIQLIRTASMLVD